MARVKNAQLAPGDTPEPRLRILGEEQVVSEAHALVANTEHEARELIEYYDADPHRVHVVPPGVDLTTFSDLSPQGLTRDQERARHGFTPNDNVVVFAGRIQPLKGADVLVQMLGELAHGQQARRERGATDDVQAPQLVILGGASGKESALDDLKRLVHALGVGRQVRFEPPCTREELAAWFRIADVVAMPSRNESFGLVAVEAQACGTPVIAAEVGGLRTAVRHGESGLLIPNHDPVTWAQETRRFFSDPELRERLAANARSVAATFTWQHAAKATLEVYDGVIKERTKIS
jgi:D-inositol-3-phosphate glycosyltransferase